MQLSNHIYCDPLFENIAIENLLLPNPYKEYPYLIIENFFTPELLKEIVDYSKQKDDIAQAKIKATVVDGIVQPKLNIKQRKTNILKLNKQLSNIYNTQFQNFQPQIEEFFNTPLTFSTKVQMLQYKKGFFYKKHADDSSELVDENSNTVGFINVAPQRKVTTVLFATTCQEENDGYSFSGGELIFNYLYDKENNQIKLKPKAGDMVIFPSNPYFSHEVLPVTDGYRLTLVQWHDGIIQ